MSVPTLTAACRRPLAHDGPVLRPGGSVAPPDVACWARPR